METVLNTANLYSIWNSRVFSSYVVIPFLAFAFTLTFQAISTDGYERRLRGGKSRIGHTALRFSIRMTMILAGFIIMLSFPLTNSELFISAEFSTQKYFQRDMISLKNILHGAFVVRQNLTYALEIYFLVGWGVFEFSVHW